MKIGKALPSLLRRQYPVVKAGYPLLTVLYLLRMQDVDAVPIVPVAKGARAVFGFSSLPRFMRLSPGGFADVLRGPCEAASDELSLVDVDDDVDALFRAFESRRLGFALVRDKRKPAKYGLVGLTDILGLYGKGIVQSEMDIDDVSTPIFSLPGETSIRKSLQGMFRKRHRRVFLLGEEPSYVSDRSIMNYLFSPAVLEELGRDEGKSDFLSAPISKMEKVAAARAEPGTRLKSAALMLSENRGSCLVTAEKRVVTPWDVVMKPWLSGALSIR